VLGVGFCLGLLLRLSSLLGCLLLSPLLGFFLLPPAAYGPGGCANGCAGASIPSDRANGCTSGGASSGTLDCSSLRGCCGRLLRCLLLSSLLLLRAGCRGWRGLNIYACLLLGRAVAIVFVFELLFRILLIHWISK